MDVNRFDVVVVGAGTAGIPTALAAAEGGARVLLLDKRDTPGGMLHVSTGQFSGADTRRQRSRGIRDTIALHEHDVHRLAHGRANAELVHASVVEQGHMVDWLDDLGFDFLPESPRLVYGHELYSVPRTYEGRDGGRSILRVFERELDRASRQQRLTLRLAARVTRLLQDDSGQILGVQTDSETIHAQNVVVATGGYAANRTLVSRFLPPAYRGALTGCLEHATGDGLLLSEAAGAAATPGGTYLPTMGLLPDPDRPGFTLNYLKARLLLVPAYRQPHEIWVNLLGQRWVAEDTASPAEREQALLRQPELTMAVVWDARALQAAEPLLQPSTDWTRARLVDESRRGRFIWQASSLADLARKLGVNADGLSHSVSRYNAAVDARCDVDFGRQFLPGRLESPPYYGLISRAAMLMSRDGPPVNADLQVLSRTGEPIPGLFAVGEVVGLTVLTLLLYGALGGLLVLIPYVLIQAAGYSGTAAGAALLPFPLILAVTAPIMGGLAGRIGSRLPLSIGPMVVAIGFLLACAWGPAPATGRSICRRSWSSRSAWPAPWRRSPQRSSVRSTRATPARRRASTARWRARAALSPPPCWELCWPHPVPRSSPASASLSPRAPQPPQSPAPAPMSCSQNVAPRPDRPNGLGFPPP